MRVADELTGRLKAQLAKIEKDTANVHSAEWERCYRLLVVGSLNDIPRSKLPQDLAAVGILVQAAELLPWALFVACGNQDLKGFAGGGIVDLLQWLDRCYELFVHVAEVHPDLPVGVSGPALARMCRHTAGEVRYLSGQLREALEQLNEHQEEHDDKPGSRESCAECKRRVDVDGNQLSPLFVPGANFAHISAHLYELISEWLDPRTNARFMDRITIGNRDLMHSRTLARETDEVIGN